MDRLHKLANGVTSVSDREQAESAYAIAQAGYRQAMADLEVAKAPADPQKAAEHTRRIERARQTLAQAEADWIEAAAALEAASQPAA